MSSRLYIHGTSEREQRRLVEQADLLRRGRGARPSGRPGARGGGTRGGRSRSHSPKPDQEGDS